MDKTGEVEIKKTPCVSCGMRSETEYNGEAYCMSCYIKKKWKVPPLPTKLAEDHSEDH